jgi:hypothetical protein
MAPAMDAIPWHGSTYTISDYSDSNQVITYYSEDGSVKLDSYDETNASQKWECRIKDGWFGFVEGSDDAYYLGFNSDEIIVAAASDQQKWEDFTIRQHPSGGYQLWMRKDETLCPVGKNSGNLKMLHTSDDRFGFTKRD